MWILVRELESWNVDVKVSDPWADADEVSEEYGIVLHDQNDLADVDALIVAVGHDEYRTMSAADWRSLCSKNTAVFGDLKSIYNKDELKDAGFTVFRL